MCGICGSLSLARRPVDPGPVRSMLDAMVHRGPDAGGLFAEPGIVAGIRRLAVIDLEGGEQPMANEDGSVRVVFNGEIYNHADLRRSLEPRGHTFRTRSDTEVLVHLWEEYGPRMLDELNGMFAFCLHDARRGETFLARDRMGIKPLYTFAAGDRLVFASEPSVLLRHPEVPAEIDPEALAQRFALQYVPGGGSVYRGVCELPPGHALHVREGTSRVTRYWEIPQPDPAPRVDPGAAPGPELRALLEDAVRLRLVADVPVGLFLSGGLDSSVLLSVAARLAPERMQTFSLGFDEAGAFDERSHAREVAAHFGSEHHELVLSPLKIAEYLPRLVAHLAEPVTDPALIPTWLLARAARERVVAVLAGEGADELFGGYRRYLYQNRFGWLSRVPGLARARPAAGRLPRRIEQALDAAAESDPARNHLEWSSTVGLGEMARLFEPGLCAAVERRIVEHFRTYFPGGESGLGLRLRADQHEWLPHDLLAKVDRATMAASLEARVPFLDHRIVEWAAALPDAWKIRGGTTKRVLRETFAADLPPGIAGRNKRGFDLPLDAWIRGPLRELACDLIRREQLQRWPGLLPDRALQMLERHLDGGQDYGLPLFAILSTMIFLRAGS